MKKWCNKLIENKWFELFINGIIIVNCILIGVETYFKSSTIVNIQHLCVLVFIVEIVIRLVAAKNMKTFFTGGWNIFDLSLVLISLVPESIFSNSAAVTSLRILRVFRVLRLMRTSTEIKLIINVLIRSFKALTYNAVFFLIFMYLFAIVGVTVFKMPSMDKLSPDMQTSLIQYNKIAPNAPEISPDPYGTLHEAMFTLFRVTTGEDWTDIRYNLLEASKMGLVHVPAYVVTMFHVIWFSLSAFLLLNLLVGAVVNNYQVIMQEMKTAKKV
ncbi:voltage-gated sodium channel [Parelusimicrobium proximum]|uniref:ion transporter n=1 Tax=Parelusimicrobium proximum TaxID=3228953 RepID=UPI003D178125